MGTVLTSGLRVREKYADWDAEALYPDLEVTSEVADPKDAPDDTIVEVSFTVVDPGGPPRRFTRRQALHREWSSYFWIGRGC